MNKSANNKIMSIKDYFINCFDEEYLSQIKDNKDFPRMTPDISYASKSFLKIN